MPLIHGVMQKGERDDAQIGFVLCLQCYLLLNFTSKQYIITIFIQQLTSMQHFPFLPILLLLLPIITTFDWTPLHTLINTAITDHAFPGASITVATHNQTLFRGNYGHLSYRHQVWQLAVNNNTKYEVDSLTKVMATGLNIMNLLSSNTIQLTDHVSKYIEHYDTNKKGNTTIGDLLMHSAGLPEDYTSALPKTQEEFVDILRFMKPIYPVGTQQLFSNLGYYLLGKIVENVTKKSFNQYFLQNRVFAGMNNTMFNPMADFGNTAPTQFDHEMRKRIVRGETHDHLAYKYGGVAGHCGLFSTGDDLTRFMRIMLNNGKLPQTPSRVLPQAIVEKFITKASNLPFPNTRSYGFDTICPGEKMKNCFRLDGSTGVVAVADKDRNVVVTILTNRGHPDVGNNRFAAYKGKIVDVVMGVLGY